MLFIAIWTSIYVSTIYLHYMVFYCEMARFSPHNILKNDFSPNFQYAFSNTRTHTHAHHVYNVMDRFTFPFLPNDKLIFFHSPQNEMWLWVCVCVSLCVCLFVGVCTTATKIYSIEFFRLKWKLCRSCIMFCLLTYTQGEQRGGAGEYKTWYARVLYMNVNHF